LHDELMRMNRQLVEVLSKVEILATTDLLTELFNRRFFESVMEREFLRTLRYQTPACCLMIDIDNFKRINDEYGHGAGDVCLREVADKIVKNIRKVDTAAKWGGEEFTVLLPNTRKGNAVTPASRIRDAISTHKFSTVTGQVTASIGIACVPDASIDTFDKFIHAADLAMYEAKTRGGNRIEFA
jgi:diguanylate cyclase (GGDEF)-like protein